MKKFNSTKDIQSNDILRVYKKGYGYVILTVIEVNEYYISVSVDNEEFFNYIAVNDTLEIYYWIENIAFFEFILQVSGKLVSEKHVFFLNHTKKIEKSEARKCLSARVNIPIKYFIFDPRRIDKKFTANEVYYHFGSVIELSDREAKIETKDILPDNIYIYGHIMIEKSDFELIGHIEPITTKKKLYHVSFRGMEDKERNRLRDYVFNIYRE